MPIEDEPKFRLNLSSQKEVDITKKYFTGNLLSDLPNYDKTDPLAISLGEKLGHAVRGLRNSEEESKFIEKYKDDKGFGEIKPFSTSKLDITKVIKLFENPGGDDDKKFNDEHRDADKGMDEWIATALVRQIIKGLHSVASFKDYPAVNTIIYRALSVVRAPTKVTGWKLGSKALQHPTGEDPFYSSPTSEASSLHSSMDRERKIHILADAFEEAHSNYEKSSFTEYIEKVLHRMVRTATAYTLNNMFAPVHAKNVSVIDGKVKPSADKKSSDAFNISNNIREEAKNMYVKLGGTLNKGGNHNVYRTFDYQHTMVTRKKRKPFAGHKRERSPSPFRSNEEYPVS